MKFEITLSPENRIGKVKDYTYEGELICSQNTKEITLEKLQKAVTPPYSRTWSNIVFSGNRRTSNFKSMQVIALDFDNKVQEEIITPLQVVERCKENGFDVSLIYSTFSGTEKLPRFRTIWILDKVITEAIDAQAFINILYQLFPEADNAKDLARLWLGGKAVLYTSEYILPLEKLVELESLMTLTNSSSANKARSFKRYWMKSEKRLYNYIGESDNSSFSKPRYESSDVLLKYDWDFARRQCKILDDLLTTEIKVWHNDLIFLASNMFRIEGGQKLFKKAIESNPNINDNKKEIIQYVKGRWNTSSPILPFSFQSLPQKHKDYMLGTQYRNILDIKPHGQYSKAILIEEEKELMPLDEAQSKMTEVFETALNDKSNAIYVFKFHTGLGKSRMATQQKGVLMAMPTHDLKEELSSKSQVQHMLIPRPPLQYLPEDMQKDYKEYCDAGLIRKASHLIRKVGDNPYRYGLGKAEATKILDFLEVIDKCGNTDLSVYTTHQNALHRNYENKNTYIFDEDPFQTMTKSDSFTTSDLRIIANALMTSKNMVDADKVESLADMLHKNMDLLVDRLPDLKFDDWESVVKAIQDSASEINGNVFAFLANPNTFYCINPVKKKDPKGDKKISYMIYTPLREDKKYIILSATADEFIYKRLYGDRVKFVDISNVETKGNVEQYSDMGCSRRCFTRNSNKIKEIDNFKKKLPTITFLTHKNNFSNPVSDIHFQKCEGSNKLSGQSIKVVGTPHINSTAYKLMCNLLNVDTKAFDFEFERMKIRHNGYEFNFTTSLNPDVQKIQFFCIEKELVQAVGRARLLHHDCTVYLFSDYPIPNARQLTFKNNKAIRRQLYKKETKKKAA